MTGAEILGRVALSTAGRDAGRHFLVVGVADEAHVYVADGSLRRMERPKLKKYRHIKLLDAVDAGLGQRLLDDKPVADNEVRESLAAMGYDTKKD